MIAPTWEQHCAEYQPGRYSTGENYHTPRAITPAVINRDAAQLEHLLTCARWRLDNPNSGWRHEHAKAAA